MKNFESNQETQKAKKLSKKKSVVTIRKNKVYDFELIF